MEKKWAIFRIVLIIQLIIAISIAILFGNLVFRTYQQYSEYRGSTLNKALIMSALIIAILLLAIFFDSFFLYLIHRKYPDKELSSTNKVLYIISIMSISITILCFVGVTIYGFSETVNDWESNNDIYTILLLIFLIIYSISLVYSLINGIKLNKFTKKNAIANSATLINEIGT